ncbi:type 4a pilus biogenesis protein PilO [Candidatus Gottesmanbacteria bacterium]|nr:type 4a pilus biogenesis protein PilO [Candidatus Gottesmanbacteria bacterium]
MPTDDALTLTRYKRYYRTISDVAKKPETKVYSTAVFSFLAVSLLGLYAILPTVRTILFLRREITDKIKVDTQMEDKIAALIESQSAYEAAADKIPLVTTAIPSTASPIELSLTLKNLAGATGASISAIQVATVPLVEDQATSAAQTKAHSLAPFSVNLTVNGAYTSLKAFLDGLVSLQRIVTIDSIRIVPASETTSSRTSGVSLQLILQLKAYYQNL